ncbi:MAG: M64 family metallopeptidase [Marinilabiliales bacterium]|nr:M64 family metallopeptidase [Marinilabiliales bacterium]
MIVIVEEEGRRQQCEFRQIWRAEVDPASRQVNEADLAHIEKVFVIAENGPAENKVDIVVLGDGYAADEMEKFRRDASRLSSFLMNAEPFSRRSKRFQYQGYRDAV